MDQQLTTTTRMQLSTALDVSHMVFITSRTFRRADSLQTGQDAYLASNAIGTGGYFPLGKGENHPFLPKDLTSPVRGYMPSLSHVPFITSRTFRTADILQTG
jgi:hypothetical protein